jgi:hypothetical protein
MSKTNRTLGFRAAVFAAALLAFAACNSLENKSTSNTILRVEALTGLDLAAKDSNFCQSDVLFTDSTTGASTYTDDVAKATLSALLMDPKPIIGTSVMEDIVLDKYVVSYTRTDGRNTPGVDVPYQFEQSFSGVVGVGKQVVFSIFIVRASAKQEPPLSNLLLPTTRGEVLYTNARVDFYGHDMTGKTVTATGYLPVQFAEFYNAPPVEPAGHPPVPFSIR